VRAGLPKDWLIGDKTGTGAFGSTNTIGFFKPAGSDRELFFSVYMTQSKATIDAREAVHKSLGEIFATLV
ncbi:GES family class A beta-lactamase, partial [Klebsiella pneumoniae]